jgi:hypothetical protein
MTSIRVSRRNRQDGTARHTRGPGTPRAWKSDPQIRRAHCSRKSGREGAACSVSAFRRVGVPGAGPMWKRLCAGGVQCRGKATPDTATASDRGRALPASEFTLQEQCSPQQPDTDPRASWLLAGTPSETHWAATSSRQDRMAVRVFTPASGYFLTGTSASFLRYLAGSLSNFFLQSLQHSLISWPS